MTADTERLTLPKKYDRYVFFASWCALNKVYPRDAAELVVLAHRAFKHQTDELNINSPDVAMKSQRATTKFELRAIELGYTVRWPSLMPQLKAKGGDWFDLPSGI